MVPLPRHDRGAGFGHAGMRDAVWRIEGAVLKIYKGVEGTYRCPLPSSNHPTFPSDSPLNRYNDNNPPTTTYLIRLRYLHLPTQTQDVGESLPSGGS